MWFPWLSPRGTVGSDGPPADAWGGRPGSGTGLLNGLVEVLDRLVHRDLGGGGRALQVVVGDVFRVAVVVVRHTASAGQAHGSLPPSATAVAARGARGPGGALHSRCARPAPA